MTGAEWLEQVFERGLRIRDPAAYLELLGALRALRACGVLAEDVAREAEQRLNDRFSWPASSPPDPSLQDLRVAGATAARAHDALQAVLAPAQPLADVDDITVVLVSVELWTSGMFVRLAGLRTELTDELDAEFDGAMRHRVARRVALRTRRPARRDTTHRDARRRRRSDARSGTRAT
jgi:hypothetical protein